MMHEWLNVCQQKGHMENDTTCPCCALEEEDQVHLYHCENQAMQECIENVIDKMERVNIKNIFQMPDQVVVNAYKRWELVNYNKRYIEMLKSAMQKKPERYLKDELKKYRLSKSELIREYGLKLVTWSTITAAVLKLCSVI